MHDERTSGATTFRFLELVRPAPVVRHCSAAEQIRLGCGGRWIVHENEDDLAAHIHVLEVVPLVFWSVSPVPDEDQVTARAAGRYGAAGPGHDVLRVAQARGGLVGRAQANRGAISGDNVDRHLLQIRGVQSRAQPEGAELRCKILRGEPSAACCGSATLEQVRAEVPQIAVDLRGGHPGGSCGLRAEQIRNEKCDENWAHDTRLE